MLGGRDETRGDAAGGRSGSALGRGHLRPLSSQVVVDRASISTITHDQQRSGVVLTGSSRSSQKLAPSLQHSSDAPSRTSTPTATSQLRALRMPHGSPNATERARRRSEVVEGDPKGICLARGEGQRGLLGKTVLVPNRRGVLKTSSQQATWSEDSHVFRPNRHSKRQ